MFSAWNGDGQTSRGGGSLSRQLAGFEKAEELIVSLIACALSEISKKIIA